MTLLTQEIAELDSLGAEVGGGTFTFPQLLGNPSVPEIIAEVLRRRGVDGAGVRVTTTTPEEFSLLSLSYVADYAAAKDAIADYQGLVGKQYGVKLTKDDIEWGVFDVLRVKEAEPPSTVLAKVSGSPGGAAVRHVCSWLMIYRGEVPEEEEP